VEKTMLESRWNNVSNGSRPGPYVTATPSHPAVGTAVPAQSLAEAAGSAPDARDFRRREIAQALRGVRRRNRIAIGALAASCAMSFAGFCALWWVKAQESKDPVVPVFRMPIELRTPFEFVKSETTRPTGGTGTAGGAGSVAPSSDSGSGSVSR